VNKSAEDKVHCFNDATLALCWILSSFSYAFTESDT
jgi:hypothetical protein